ncbi:MAG: alpha-amylase [Draconibacterium sp.]|nr:alpha-amylase [Draconibacterium sp.]
MKTVCLFFQVHQPFRHRRYHFFDIGNDHYYYDDFTNESIMNKIATKSYLPTNKLLLKLANQLRSNFKVSFSITGQALEQFQLYAPEVIESFQKLVKTGCVEFLSETYSHSLSSLKDKIIFEEQIKLHDKKIVELFGIQPRVFRNTEMIYSDEIGAHVAELGYTAMLTEGAKHVLGWKSPNYLYVNALNPRLKVLMRNFKLSDDIAFRFADTNWSDYPLTAEKFISWLENINPKDEVVNLFLSYEAIGDRQAKETGIFNFLESLLVKIAKHPSLKLATPSEMIEELQPISIVSVPTPISWADEERDLTAWLGNGMQKEAFGKLYSLSEQIRRCTDEELLKDWNYLQVSDHFYYMSTKYFSDGKDHSYNNPFNTPFEAFVNYMNVLSDFKIRLNSFVPVNEIDSEIASLHNIIIEKVEKIKKLEANILALQKRERRKK